MKNKMGERASLPWPKFRGERIGIVWLVSHKY